MNFRYTLEWLDLIICVTLNPDKTDLSAITEKQIEMIRSQTTNLSLSRIFFRYLNLWRPGF